MNSESASDSLGLLPCVQLWDLIICLLVVGFNYMFPLVFFLLFFLTLTVVAEYKQIYFYSTGETAGT